MLKPNEIRNMSQDEIIRKVTELKKVLYGLRSDAEAGNIEKPHRIRQTRREIARCETILKEMKNAEPKKV